MPFLENNAEGMPHGTTLASGQAGSGTAFYGIGISGEPVAIYSNDRAAHGSQSYRITGPASTVVRPRLQGSLTSNEASLRAYVYFEEMPSALMALAQIVETGGSTAALIAVTTAGRLRVQDKNGILTDFATPLITGQWYRIELRLTVGATATEGLVRAAFYSYDDTIPINPEFSSTTADLGILPLFRAEFGKCSLAPTVDMFIDDFAFNIGSSDAIGPVEPPPNVPPIANAGPNQTTIEPWSTVTLDGSGSVANVGTITSYLWAQTAGMTVTLSDPTSANPTFTAPASITNQTLTFQLVVEDSQGISSTADSVDVVVLYATERAIIDGQEVPLRPEVVQL